MHENKMPKNFNEKKEFVALIETMRKEPIQNQVDSLWKLQHENDSGTEDEKNKHQILVAIRFAGTDIELNFHEAQDNARRIYIDSE